MAKSPSPLVSPFSLYAMARSNLQGAVRIAISMSPEQRDRDTCIQFLLGFVAEGYFKAHLAFAGVCEDCLRKRIGHDIQKARQACIDAGLPIENCHQIKFLVDTMHLGHLEHYYRYLPDNHDGSERQFRLIQPLLAFESLKLLDRAVFPFLLPEINRELVRQGKSTISNWPGVDGLA